LLEKVHLRQRSKLATAIGRPHSANQARKSRSNPKDHASKIPSLDTRV